MPGLVPGTTSFSSCRCKDVDGRDKPGHDGMLTFPCNSIPNSARYNRAMTHDHHHDHSHAHGHAHSHAADSFGAAFAIGAALNTAFVIAELIFGYAANSLAL